VNFKGAILFADDSEDQALILEGAFQQAGWSVPLTRVVDGKMAIAYIDGAGEYADRKKYPYPRFLLLDLWMPEVNGFEVLKWVRTHPRHRRLPIFVLTSEHRQQMAKMAYDLGANCLLPKPKNFEETIKLAEGLRSYLEVIQMPPAPE
jgi:CheY-like chemotaxis protein